MVQAPFPLRDGDLQRDVGTVKRRSAEEFVSALLVLPPNQGCDGGESGAIFVMYTPALLSVVTGLSMLEVMTS